VIYLDSPLGGATELHLINSCQPSKFVARLDGPCTAEHEIHSSILIPNPTPNPSHLHPVDLDPTPPPGSHVGYCNEVLLTFYHSFLHYTWEPFFYSKKQQHTINIYLQNLSNFWKFAVSNTKIQTHFPSKLYKNNFLCQTLTVLSVKTKKHGLSPKVVESQF